MTRYVFILYIFCLLFSTIEGAESKKKILFIVNPISHELLELDFKRIVSNNLDPSQYDYDIVYTEYRKHAYELALKAANDHLDVVAAVGGDGTVNEVAKALINRNISLAIIPAGSGNGLARHLGIPINPIKAVRALNHAHQIVIDTAKINDQTFLSVAGVGFDARVAWEFSGLGKRGKLAYLQAAFKEFPSYDSKPYLLTIDGEQRLKKAFILSFANGSQYGNGFVIASQARLQDGYLDLIIVEDLPGYALPAFLYRFKQGTLQDSGRVESIRFKELTVHQQRTEGHVDGEPVIFQGDITIKVLPASLKILVPNS